MKEAIKRAEATERSREGMIARLDWKRMTGVGKARG
jgi:hypothetical protein